MFNRGNQKRKEEQAEQKRRRVAGKRFFLKKGSEEAKSGVALLFLERVSADPETGTIGLHQHALEVDGDWKGHIYTCTRDLDGFDGCPLCERRWKDKHGNLREYGREWVNIVTVIDLHEYTSRDGSKTFKNSKKMLAMKDDPFETLLLENKDLVDAGQADGLKMHVVRVRRIGDRSATVGDNFKVIRKIDPAAEPILDHEDKPIDLSPFNYEEILAGQPREFFDEMFEHHNVLPANAKYIGGAGGTSAVDGNTPPDLSDTPADAESEQMDYGDEETSETPETPDAPSDEKTEEPETADAAE